MTTIWWIAGTLGGFVLLLALMLVVMVRIVSRMADDEVQE
jgi:Na+-transporting methylmalonyl-CoA/oxaloacetate decarboxylase gamma subunit